MDALTTAKGGRYKWTEVTGPLGEKVKAKYGIIDNKDEVKTSAKSEVKAESKTSVKAETESKIKSKVKTASKTVEKTTIGTVAKTAVIEMAEASGLPLIGPTERNPLLTTTYGTGEMIKSALDEGIREFIIGIGGSATNDGGIGAAQALGVQFIDSEGKEVGFGGGELSKIKHISIESLDSRIKESKITVICDVNNPLTGERGATAVFGPQKGAKGDMLKTLENGMKNYAEVISKHFGMDVDKIPGSGAAGGLGAALICFFGAEIKSGIDTILDFVEFEKLLNGVDLVITGEGRIDGQSVFGKVPVGIARRCKKYGIKVVVITGSMGDKAQDVYEYGIDSIMTTINKDMSLDEAMSRSKELLMDAVDRMFRLIKLGMTLGCKYKRRR
ncbi:MAG TPA: glycerate kinase [Clostridiaceae bacterium]|nr:glycerate kinase [Clostridiaceae bacterium]